MSFIAYLCWLLGITGPTDCAGGSSYQSWVTDACSVDEDVVDTTTNTTKEQGQHNDAPRHSRGTNISVSI